MWSISGHHLDEGRGDDPSVSASLAIAQPQAPSGFCSTLCHRGCVCHGAGHDLSRVRFWCTTKSTEKNDLIQIEVRCPIPRPGKRMVNGTRSPLRGGHNLLMVEPIKQQPLRQTAT